MKTTIPIEIDDLPQRVRDWIIAESSHRKVTPSEVLKQLAEQRAKEHGFTTGVPLVVASTRKAGE